MIRKVLIDLDGICAAQCPAHGTIGAGHYGDHGGMKFEIPVWSLLKQIMSRPELNVEFVHVKGKKHHDFTLGTMPRDWRPAFKSTCSTTRYEH
jgi:hypothetical protein